MSLNASWHEAHRLPRNASAALRIAWHLEHARECGCRALPATLLQVLTPAQRREAQLAVQSRRAAAGSARQRPARRAR